MSEAANVHVRTEVPSRLHGLGSVRADVQLQAAHGTITVEVKTIDLRCASYKGSTLAKEAKRLGEEIKNHYGGRAGPLVLSHSGAHTRATADTLAKLQAIRQNSAPHLADAVPLLPWLGRTCAQVEAQSLSDWQERVESVLVARTLAPPEEERGPDSTTTEISEQRAHRETASGTIPRPSGSVPNRRSRRNDTLKVPVTECGDRGRGEQRSRRERAARSDVKGSQERRRW